VDSDPKTETIKLREFAATMEFLGPISKEMIDKIVHLIRKQ
jgi:hypothetical protein